MRLAVLNLTGGGISGGHKKYLRNMLPRLAAFPEIEAILCASPAGMRTGEWLPAIPKVTTVACGAFRPLRHTPDPGLARALDEFRPDLILVSIERYLKYKDLPTVVMLQNMAPLAGIKTGCGLKERLVAMARRHETRVALDRAAAVLVPTGSVKSFLAAKAGVPDGKITAVHYGYNAPAGAARPPERFPFAGRDFIFTAGSLEAYRGLEDLVTALPRIKDDRPGIKLAVAGGARPETRPYLNMLKELAKRFKVSSDIAWLGDLPEEELSWCYANCSAFALTSRVESFCFVAVEALAHGCNIVSTDSPCLPEILGDSALYYKAGDEKGLAAGLAAVLSRTSAERQAAGSAAAARAAGFSWDTAASATLSVLRKAAQPR